MTAKLKFEIKGNVFEIDFPKTGKIIDIEKNKMILSDGTYGTLFAANTVTARFAIDAIDMESYFRALCPELFKKLKISSIEEMEIEDMIELKKFYSEQFVPWWFEIVKLIKNVVSEKETAE